MHLKFPCLRCGKFPPECACPPLPVEPEELAPASTAGKPRSTAIIKMRREKRGGGREVVILEGFPAHVALEDLARELKRRCATGGTVKGRTIELQGDPRDVLPAILLEHGFPSKRAGG